MKATNTLKRKLVIPDEDIRRDDFADADTVKRLILNTLKKKNLDKALKGRGGSGKKVVRKIVYGFAG